MPYRKLIGRVPLCAAIFSLVTFTGNAFAQWTYRVAPDPYIRTISTFANTPVAGTTTLIVSTLSDGMLKGTDPGGNASITWQRINIGLPTVQIRTHNPVDVNTIYAGTDGAGIFKTTNGGATWTAINGSGMSALGCSNVRSINTDPPVMPATLRILTVGTSCRNNSGFYKSNDDGATWSRLGNSSLPDDVSVSALLRSGANYFLASSDYGVFKSADFGATWVAINNGLSAPSGTLNAFNIAFNGTAPLNLVTYIHGSGIYRSTDGGTSWIISNTGMPAGFAALGGINSESNAVKYIGLDKQGVYKTTDGGATWAPWGNSANDDRTKFARGLAVVTAGSTYYFATYDGIAKTTTNAVTINGTEMGGGGRVNSITHDRDTPFKTYVTAATAYQLNYVYGDFNVSGTASQIDTGITGNTIDGTISQDSLNPQILYVTTGNRGLFKSTNGGASFSAINNGLPSMIGQINRLAIDPTNSQILYLGLSDAAGVFKSTDGGQSWVATNSGLVTVNDRSINSLLIDPNNAAILYASTGGGLFKSIDSAATWTLKYSALDAGGSVLPTSNMRVKIGNSQVLYIANYHANANGALTTSSGLHRSLDGGNTWANVLLNQGVSSVRVLNNGDVYAGVSSTVGNPAVWISTDGGATFFPYSGGLNGSDIRTMAVAADRSAMLSISLENGMYTHNPAGPPAPVTLTSAIADTTGVNAAIVGVLPLFTNLYFGYQAVNTTSVPKAVAITNNTGSSATIVGFGTNSDHFGVASHNCPSILVAGASCIVNVIFNPQFGGVQTGVLSTIGPLTGVAVNLRGFGVTPGLTTVALAHDPGMVPAYPDFYSPGPTFREITFGTQGVNVSRTISVTLRNFGTVVAPFSVSGFSGQFSVSNSCGASVPAGGSCLLNVTYLPTVVAIDNQTLTVTIPGNMVAPSFAILLYGIAENTALDGSLVAAFGTAGKALISTGPYGPESLAPLSIQPDGKILAMLQGRKAPEDGTQTAAVVRLNADGSLDTSWGTGGIVRLNPSIPGNFFGATSGLYARPDGTVIVAFASGTSSTTAMEVHRLLGTGAIDTTFGTAGVTTILNLDFNRLDIYPDGRMLAVGNADSVNNNKLGMIRLLANGNLDPAFGTGGRVELLLPEAMQLGGTQGTIRTRFAADEKIFVAYGFGVGSARDIALYKLTTSGAIDTGWGAAGRVNVAATNREDNVRNMRVQLDGKIILLSRTARIAGGGAYESVMTRLNADGSVDTTFGTAGVVTTTVLTSTNLVSPIRILADGKILVAGSRNCGGACLSGRDGYVARYNIDGSLDVSFGNGGIKEIVLAANFDAIFDMDIAADGNILVAGQVTQNDMDRGNTIDNVFIAKLKNTVGPALVNLTVTKVGAGSVTSMPAGIDCGATCLASFGSGTMVTLTAASVGGSVFTGWSGGGCSGTGTCSVTLTLATSVTATFTGGGMQLLNVKSRKTHGAAGDFDLPIVTGIPINGIISVEPRLIGPGHLVVFTFDAPITSTGSVAVVDAVPATIGLADPTFSGNEVRVRLTGIADQKRVKVTLTGVNGTTNAEVTLGFMVGDLNATQRVAASDVAAVKARFGTTTNANYLMDVNLSGSVTGADVSVVKARSGSQLP